MKRSELNLILTTQAMTIASIKLIHFYSTSTYNIS